jgi:hypothetical protein
MAVWLTGGPCAPCVAGETILPFTTDGCSDFPDGTPQQKTLWLSCCVIHDQAYWRGGSYEERLEADRELQRCVAKVGEPKIAALMLAGVRVGGSPLLPMPFRWGYGWTWPRDYRTLTSEELAEIERALRAYESAMMTLPEKPSDPPGK